MNKGLTEAAAAAGVDLAVFNANSDSAKQVQAIQTYVDQGYQAIIVSPIDENGLVDALQAAKDAGVVTIVIDSGMESPGVDLSIGTDNLEAGRTAGQWLLDWQASNPGDLSVGIVSALTSVPQNKRADGFASVVEPAGVKILQTVNGNNVQATAETAARSLFTAQPTMNLLYATGEPALIGAVAGVKNADSAVKIFGWDLSPSAIAGLDDGSVIGVIQQTPGVQGAIAIESALTLLDGGTLPKNIPTGIVVVTKDTVDEYRELYGS
jgi:ribose transport system substrate-binding protein